MSTIDLRERLIGKIQQIENSDILAEAYRLLGLELEVDEPYKLSQEQKNAVKEAREQIKNGAFLTDAEADNDIDEWLKK
jgi:hypothetical protein